MVENKMCPHCGSQMFMATITRGCVIEVITDPDNPYKILKEGKDKFDIEILKCARCKETITETDLVTGVKCKECGKIVGPMDINADGVCNVCEAIKQRTELANASKEDLIKMLLDAEKKANPVAVKMEKQIEKADDIVTESNEESTDETEKKPRRKASRKKKDDTSEDSEDSSGEVIENSIENKVSETISEETPQEVPVETNDINDLANQQDAPFPDMNPPVEETQVDTTVAIENEPVAKGSEQAIGADFHMFDDGEEAF